MSAPNMAALACLPLELVRNAPSQVLPQTKCIRNSGWNLTICIKQAFQVTLMHLNVQKPLDYVDIYMKFGKKRWSSRESMAKVLNAVEEKPRQLPGLTRDREHSPQPEWLLNLVNSSSSGLIGSKAFFQDLFLTSLPSHLLSHPFSKLEEFFLSFERGWRDGR